MQMHILPFAGDELPPSAAPAQPSTSTSSSTLTLTRLLHGAVTAKRHALLEAEAAATAPPAASVPWTEDDDYIASGGGPETQQEQGGYCPCFGGRVCPRESCEWRESVGGGAATAVATKRGRIREEMVRGLVVRGLPWL